MNLFDRLELIHLRKLWEMIIDAIVGTDMRFHFQHLKNMESLKDKDNPYD